jgi:nucleoside-diphosphate-sugar epimerase
MIAVTGSHGFVGMALLAFAALENISLRAIPRKNYLNNDAYRGCDVVIHLAGLAHRKSATSDDFMAVNCDLAVSCAEVAASAGVNRFIYVSSSKALRDFAESDQALDETTKAAPGCDYGRSKLAAEEKLWALGETGAIQVIIIRPALVIGAPAKANLRSLAKLAQRASLCAWSLSLSRWAFSGFQAPRSYTSLENLCSALIHVARSTTGRAGTFHVVDDEVMSTSELFQKLVRFGNARWSKTGAFNEPKARPSSKGFSAVLEFALRSLGLNATFNAIGRPFVLNGTKIQRQLGWKPQNLVDVELQRIMANLPFSGEGSKG